MAEDSPTLFNRRLTTRGYEADDEATLPIQRILNFLEWLRWEFIQAPDTGLSEALATGHFPVVRSQRVQLLRRVGMGRELRLWVRVLKVGRSSVTLEHHVIDEHDGALVAHAIVEGLWLGPGRGLVRIPDRFRTFSSTQASYPNPAFHYAAPSPAGEPKPLIHTRPEMKSFQRRDLDAAWSEPLEPTVAWETRVRPSEIDIFSHVNAATYVNYIADALGQCDLSGSGRLQRLVIQYHREALLDDRLKLCFWRRSDQGWEVRIHRPKDEVLIAQAIVWTDLTSPSPSR